jgi:hypothetical protein
MLLNWGQIITVYQQNISTIWAWKHLFFQLTSIYITLWKSYFNFKIKKDIVQTVNTRIKNGLNFFKSTNFV